MKTAITLTFISDDPYPVTISEIFSRLEEAGIVSDMYNSINSDPTIVKLTPYPCKHKVADTFDPTKERAYRCPRCGKLAV